MKSKILSLLFFGIFFSVVLNAQTTIEISYAQDSLYSSHCPTPVTIPFMFTGSCSGYDPSTDLITIQVNFGDGIDTMFQTGIYNSFPDDYFYPYPFNHAYYFAGSYAVKYIATGPDGNSDTLIHNSEVVVGDTCGNISGRIYLDIDGDCIFNNNDLAESYFPVHLYENGIFVAWSFTDANGYYWFSAPNGLTFDVIVDTSLYASNGYTPTCPSSGIYSITAPASGNDFGFSCDTDVYFSYDLYAGINGAWGWTQLVPGKTGYLSPFVANHSCIPASGIAKLVMDDPHIHYISSTPAPDLVSGDTLMWNFTAFNNFSFWNFWNYNLSTVSFQTDSFALIGDTVCFTLIIEPIAGDQDPVNNVFIFCDTIQSSYDPNFKSVMPEGVGSEGFISPNTELTYTIHFQNTGTATAENIFLLDTLDTDLNITTFRPFISSHPVMFDVIGNIVKFSFNNIQLPDSATNEAQSMGFVSYAIELDQNLIEGSQITNEAGIYFDFNSVVMTNQTLNTVDLNLEVEAPEIIASAFEIFPNPAWNNVTLKFFEASGDLIIRNITGGSVLNKKIDAKEMGLDISMLPSGIYLVTLKNQQGVYAKKFVIGR
jgi:uncharacterized repeat protein (TIGR01451 family)